jgi:hypothetical protein
VLFLYVYLLPLDLLLASNVLIHVQLLVLLLAFLLKLLMPLNLCLFLLQRGLNRLMSSLELAFVALIDLFA